MPLYHLAQLNIARMRAPIDSPEMADFVALLDSVNAVADRSPGFVWRLIDAPGRPSGLDMFEDAMILVNMSVWESVETLREYVYRGLHTTPMRRRAEWFDKMNAPHMALWWVPAGHIPTLAEARERLEFLRVNGETPYAFSFKNAFAAPGSEQLPITGRSECDWQE